MLPVAQWTLALTAANLLIIASDADLRQSLVFALESDGHRILAASDVATAMVADLSGIDCVVVDEAAARAGATELTALGARRLPVVLLSNKPLPQPPAWATGVVEMPGLGAALSQAVAQATAKAG